MDEGLGPIRVDSLHRLSQSASSLARTLASLINRSSHRFPDVPTVVRARAVLWSEPLLVRPTRALLPGPTARRGALLLVLLSRLVAQAGGMGHRRSHTTARNRERAGARGVRRESERERRPRGGEGTSYCSLWKAMTSSTSSLEPRKTGQRW